MTDPFTRTSEIIDGIERVTVTPHSPNGKPMILMIHGMWHGAWVWKDWQEQLAHQGWSSMAISLPGHGASHASGSVRFATMGRYLAVIKSIISALPQAPILMGHSMGGALIQWYIAKVSDQLPAAVLVAPWTAKGTWADGMALFAKRDPIGFLKVGFTLSTDPMIRNAEVAGAMLLGPDAAISAEELFPKLCSESALVLNQHNPPLWRPKKNPSLPMLWLAAERDAVISYKGAKASAAFYGADFTGYENAGHNLMMERRAGEIIADVAAWLEDRLPA